MSASLAKLEAKIGHKFKDLKLLERAVTHRSWAYENLAGDTDEGIHAAENESLEFIGDSVGRLNLERLHSRFDSASQFQVQPPVGRSKMTSTSRPRCVKENFMRVSVFSNVT